jgi:hypothetical protein
VRTKQLGAVRRNDGLSSLFGGPVRKRGLVGNLRFAWIEVRARLAHPRRGVSQTKPLNFESVRSRGLDDAMLRLLLTRKGVS